MYTYLNLFETLKSYQKLIKMLIVFLLNLAHQFGLTPYNFLIDLPEGQKHHNFLLQNLAVFLCIKSIVSSVINGINPPLVWNKPKSSFLATKKTGIQKSTSPFFSLNGLCDNNS